MITVCTVKGMPAWARDVPDKHDVVSGVPISLDKECAESSGVWECVATGQTNKDGRIGDLLQPSDTVLPGIYKYALPS